MKKVLPLLLVSGLMLTACDDKEADTNKSANAGPEKVMKNPKEAVTEKVNARWEALKKHDIEAAYKYLSPSYRELTDLLAYAKTKGDAVTYQTIKINSVECPGEAPEVCTAKVTIKGEYRAKNQPVQATFTEKWVKEDGDWWFYDK